MRLMTLAATAAFVLGLSATAASAEPTANELLGRTTSDLTRDELVSQMMGIEQGLGWANAQLGNTNQAKLYCQPSNLGLTSVQIINILRKYVDSRPQLGEKPAGAVMMFAFINEWPC